MEGDKERYNLCNCLRAGCNGGSHQRTDRGGKGEEDMNYTWYTCPVMLPPHPLPKYSRTPDRCGQENAVRLYVNYKKFCYHKSQINFYKSNINLYSSKAYCSIQITVLCVELLLVLLLNCFSKIIVQPIPNKYSEIWKIVKTTSCGFLSFISKFRKLLCTIHRHANVCIIWQLQAINM